MTRHILIDPVTRIEGHAKISIHLDDDGNVAEARFHVTEFRGFERFCEGRPFWEMPGITARICGICPVSHLLASAKAGDAILSVVIPPAAEKLRRLMNLGQIVQSHALSFFHLSAPDLLLGFDSDPATRNVFGLMAADPTLARADTASPVRAGHYRSAWRQQDPSGVGCARRRAFGANGCTARRDRRTVARSARHSARCATAVQGVA
jgi:coenzyme F420-reducing hydrogenase alpha subunit